MWTQGLAMEWESQAKKNKKYKDKRLLLRNLLWNFFLKKELMFLKNQNGVIVETQ